MSPENMELIKNFVGEGQYGTLNFPGGGSYSQTQPRGTTSGVNKVGGLTVGQGINEVQQAFGRHISSAEKELLSRASRISIAAGGEPITKVADLQKAGIGVKKSRLGMDFLAGDFVPDEGIAEILNLWEEIHNPAYRSEWMNSPEAITTYAPELGGLFKGGEQQPQQQAQVPPNDGSFTPEEYEIFKQRWLSGEIQ